MTGEIAGGLFNPEGLKELLRHKEINKRIEEGGNPYYTDSKGGIAVSTSKLDSSGNVVDDEGKVVLSSEELNKLLNW